MYHTREDNSSNRSHTQLLKPMKESQRACQTETEDLFKTLMSWREESNRQFYSIISSHSRSIKNGIQELIGEVGDLQAELIGMREEKNVLQRTVADFNREIEHLSAKLLALQEPEPYLNTDMQEGGKSVDENLYTEEEQDPLIQSSSLELAKNEGVDDDYDESDQVYAEDIKDEVEMLNQDQEQEKKESTTGKELPLKHRHSKKGSFKRQTNAKGQNHACNLCEYSAAHGNSLKYHMTSVHNKDQMLKCNLCPYKSASKGNLKIHIEGTHEGVRKYACGKCEYAAFRKGELIRHQSAVHNLGSKHKCEICPYASAEKSRLKYHMTSKHSVGETIKCDKCPFSSSNNYRYKYHMASKHNIGETIKCDKCPYSSAIKHKYKYHMATKHNLGEILKCDECPYTTVIKSSLKRHKCRVHEKLRRNHV